MRNSQRYKNDLEFLKSLEEHLKYLPKDKKHSVLKNYQEKINNNLDQLIPMDQILDQFDSPEDIAKKSYQIEGSKTIKKRQRKIKRQNQIKALVSIVIALFLVLTMIAIFSYFGQLFINKISLFFKITQSGLIDGFVMFFVIGGFLIINLVLGLFAIDLNIIILNWSYHKIKLGFKPDQKPDSNQELKNSELFLVTTWIKEVTDKPKLFSNILGITSIVIVFFMIGGFFVKGYPFYSLKQTVDPDKQAIYMVDTPKEIYLYGFDSKVIFSPGPTFMIKYRNQFETPLDIVEENKILKIYANDTKTYDFFNLLKEPQQVIEIIIPSDQYFSNYLENIYLEIERPSLEITTDLNYQLTIDAQLLTYISQEVTIKNLQIKALKTQFYSNLTNFQNLDITTTRGSIVLKKSKVNSFNFSNQSADLGIDQSEINQLVIDNQNAQIAISQSIINQLELTTLSGRVSIDDLTGLNMKIESIASTIFNLAKLNYQQIEATLLEGEWILSNSSGDLIINDSASLIKITHHQGSIELTSRRQTVTINGVKGVKVKLNLTSIGQVSLEKIGTTESFELNSTESTVLLSQVYSPKVVINEELGTVYYKNNYYDQVALAEDEDSFYHDIYSDLTKIKELLVSGNVSSSNVYEEKN